MEEQVVTSSVGGFQGNLSCCCSRTSDMGPPLHLAWLQMLGILRKVFSEAWDQLLVLP